MEQRNDQLNVKCQWVKVHFYPNKWISNRWLSRNGIWCLNYDNKEKLNDYTGVKSNGLYSICNKETTWYFENIENSLFPSRNQAAVIDFYKLNFPDVAITKKIMPLNNKDTVNILKFWVPCK